MKNEKNSGAHSPIFPGQGKFESFMNQSKISEMDREESPRKEMKISC